MITLLAVSIVIGTIVLLWGIGTRFDSRYREGGLKINVKRTGR